MNRIVIRPVLVGLIFGAVAFGCSSPKTQQEPPAAPLRTVEALPVQIAGAYSLVKSQRGQAGEARAYVLLAEQGIFVGPLAKHPLPGIEVSPGEISRALVNVLDEKPPPKPRPLTAIERRQEMRRQLARAVDSNANATLQAPRLALPDPARAPLVLADRNRKAADLLEVLSILMTRGALIAIAGESGTRRHVVFLEENQGCMDCIPTASVRIRRRELVVSFGEKNYTYQGTTCSVARDTQGEPDWDVLERTLKAAGRSFDDGTISLSAEDANATVADMMGILDVAAASGLPMIDPNFWRAPPADFQRDIHPKSRATEEEHQRFDDELLACEDQLKVLGAQVKVEDEELSNRTRYFRSCYERSLVRGEGFDGRLVARLRSTEDGNQEVSFDGENGPYLEQCFAHTMKDVHVLEYPAAFTVAFELLAPPSR